MRLEVFQNGQLLQEVPLQNEEVWVGRDEACVIRLDDRAISRKHVLLRSTENGVEFEKKSKFGWIKLNGAETTQAMLRDGDRLELGSFEIRVSEEKSAAKPSNTETMRLDPQVVTELPSELQAIPQDQGQQAEEASSDAASADENAGMASPVLGGFDFSSSPPEGVEAIPQEGDPGVGFENPVSQPTGTHDMGSVSNDGVTRAFNAPERVRAVLRFGGGGDNGQGEYEIGDNEIAIGRSQQCHVVLEDKRSSRRHAIIKREGLRFLLKDLGSANGTLLNGDRVDGEHELQSGDQIQIGDTVFTFQILQADYERKKEQFIPVPPHEAAAVATPLNVGMNPGLAPMSPVMAMPFANEPLQAPVQGFENVAPPSFETAPEPKKSIIGKYLDRYRAMNTKQQIIYGALILCVIWFLMDDSSPQRRAHLNTGDQQTKAQKKDTKKTTAGPTFDSLTPEQQHYIETQYQLAFDLYKNREYDKALLEVGKIFSLVQDYHNAREIEAFAREGKRAMEAKEEERKRKEAERQAQLKLQELVEQAGLLMDQKRFKEAEALFPEIELIQPENAAVNEWRKRIMVETEKIEEAKAEKKRIEMLNKKGWDDYRKAQELVDQKRYYDALDVYDDISARKIEDPKLVQTLKDQTEKVEGMIAAERDPLLDQAKQLEADGKLSEAYKAYQQAADVDPLDQTAPAGMKRIRGTLTSRAKFLYTEGVFAESYSDLDTAEKRYREVLEVVPKDDDYYLKAQSRLRKLTIFKNPASSTGDSFQ